MVDAEGDHPSLDNEKNIEYRLGDILNGNVKCKIPPAKQQEGFF